MPLLTDALRDKDWALRSRAAALLTELDPASDAKVRIRPVPTDQPEAWYARPGARHTAGVDARLPRHRSRHDSDRAGGTRRTNHRRHLRPSRARRFLRRPADSPRRSRLRDPGGRSSRR
ncbi:MAG: hypothetical protein QM736_29065 [Vicinamibacterales bacterium]